MNSFAEGGSWRYSPFSGMCPFVIAQFWYSGAIMQIMLFGGAFDPPHNGHRRIAELVIQHKLADELWFVPCFQHPFAKHMAPAADRLAMLQLIKLPRTRLCRYEIDQHTVSYSIDTLKNFSSNEPQHKFSWLIGSDAIPSFDQWKDYEELLRKYAVFVYPRAGFPLRSPYLKMQLIDHVPEIDISSTQVRAAIAQGEPIDQLVPTPIAHYIEDHALYNNTHD
jgi:nicotinate-nucleotide adenylyltransferase